MPLSGASSQSVQLSQYVFHPYTLWEKGSPCPALSMCCCCLGRRDGLSFTCATKMVFITFSHFQEKKRGAEKENCCGELVQRFQGTSGPRGSPGTAAWVVGSQNLGAALSRRSSADSQIVFLPRCHGDGKCSSAETAAYQGKKDLRLLLLPRRSMCSSKMNLEVCFLHIYLTLGKIILRIVCFSFQMSILLINKFYSW